MSNYKPVSALRNYKNQSIIHVTLDVGVGTDLTRGEALSLHTQLGRALAKPFWEEDDHGCHRYHHEDGHTLGWVTEDGHWSDYRVTGESGTLELAKAALLKHLAEAGK